MLISGIVILKKYRDDKKYNNCILFFIVGSITNFMDLLTTPILTYAIPLIIYFLLENKNKEKTPKEIMKLIIKSGIAWGLGYLLTWVAKWIIVDSVYDRNIIQNAIAQIQYRGLDINYRYLETVWRNCKGYGSIEFPIFMYLIFYNIVLVTYYTIKKEKNTNILFYVIVSALPFIWYFVVRQHSYQHAIFTHRILYITVLANIYILSECISMSKNKKVT